MKEIFQVINELVADKIIDTYAVGGAIAAHFYVEAFAPSILIFSFRSQLNRLYYLVWAHSTSIWL